MSEEERQIALRMVEKLDKALSELQKQNFTNDKENKNECKEKLGR